MEETEPTQNTEQNRETNPRQPGSGPQEETDPSTAEETEEPMPKDSAADDTSAHEHQWEEHSVIVREAWEERVLIREAWDETVVEHPAYDETIVAQEAWEEPVFEEHTFCSACGLDLTEAGISRGDHAEEAHDYNSGFTIRKVRVGTVFHEAVYEEVHHEEETQTVHHEAEYETITHEAVCRTAWICSLCGEEREP